MSECTLSVKQFFDYFIKIVFNADVVAREQVPSPTDSYI